mmetsp:Transcript_12219/g.14812  ORF Transcript_12219/g.14812 Transcript_12219/m.14812 type:complete len:377 (+) Transcript_12219:234-1364(+)
MQSERRLIQLKLEVILKAEKALLSRYRRLCRKQATFYKYSTYALSKKMWSIINTVEALLSERHPLTFVLLVPLFVLFLRLVKSWIAFLGRRLFWGGKDFSPGYYVPKVIPGSVYPYGIVELKGRRPYMEDRHLVAPRLNSDPSRCLYGVFDGHGGAAASQFCMETIGKLLEDALSSAQQPKEALKSAFKIADERFLEIARSRSLDDGTTALCVLAHGDTLTIANAGDSRAIAVKVNGQTMQLSYDHKPDRADERERITELGGSVIHWGVWRVEGVLAVSRAIGDRLLKDYVIPDPEVIRWVCSSDDMYIVLATDGLWDVFTNQQVGNMLQKCRAPQQAAEMLAKQAFLKGSTDNVTVLVVDVRAQNIEEATPKKTI